MKNKKRSSRISVWVTLAIIALAVIYGVIQVDTSSIPATPTSTNVPTVLSEQVTQAIEIGHPVKTTGCKSDGVLPDRECTPGAIDPNVTQKLINGTICTVGYTDDVRPDTDVTNPIKAAQLLVYGLTGSKIKMLDYELDHLISLQLGGCPDCIANLWPEPYNPPSNPDMGARKKDVVEGYLKRAVCKGEMTLLEAQKEIATDWTVVYYRVYGK